MKFIYFPTLRSNDGPIESRRKLSQYLCGSEIEVQPLRMMIAPRVGFSPFTEVESVLFTVKGIINSITMSNPTGACSKLPQVSWLKTTHTYYLIVLEARSPK